MSNSNSVDDIVNDPFSASASIVILPEDLIMNKILTRLPVKTLIKFKCVCKSWNSTISSPSWQFINTHLEFSSASAPHQIVLPNGRTLSLDIFPYDELNNVYPDKMKAVKVSSFGVNEDHFLYDVQVCNGLICLRMAFYRRGYGEQKMRGYYCVYNPALHQYCEVANPYCELEVACTTWFGYVPSIDDFKLVTLFFSEGAVMPHYFVYSMRRQRWVMVSDLDRVVYSFEDLKSTTPVVDGVLYWSPTDKDYDWVRRERIVGFNLITGLDLVTGQVKEFPLSSSMDWLSAYSDTSFFKMKGCLSLYCCFGDDGHLISDVWMLRQHDDWSSWEKSFSVHHGGFFLLDVNPTTGKFLVHGYEDGHRTYKVKIINPSNDDARQQEQEPEQFRGGACYLDGGGYGSKGGGFYTESHLAFHNN